MNILFRFWFGCHHQPKSTWKEQMWYISPINMASKHLNPGLRYKTFSDCKSAVWILENYSGLVLLNFSLDYWLHTITFVSFEKHCINPIECYHMPSYLLSSTYQCSRSALKVSCVYATFHIMLGLTRTLPLDWKKTNVHQSSVQILQTKHFVSWSHLAFSS